MTPTIHQGSVLKQFVKDGGYRTAEFAKALGRDRSYLHVVFTKERIPDKTLDILKTKFKFDPDNYVPNKTTHDIPLNVSRVKIPGDALKTAMKKNKIHQDRAAELLGVSRSTVIRYWQKDELERHVVDLVKEKLGIDLESDNKPEPPALNGDTDESALMNFGTTMFQKFQTIKNLASIVNVHDLDISRLKLIVDKHDAQFVGVAQNINDLTREHQELKWAVQNINKK